MPELIWLDGFSGQSIEQLLAWEGTHRIDSLVLAFEQALDQKAAREGSGSLTTEEETVLAIEALEREVNNGGFNQFFVNLSVEYAPIIVDVLNRIGCPKVAAIAADAISALRLPVVSVEQIEKVIYNDDELRSKALAECDTRFFKCPECIEEQLFAFIKANKSRISF